MNNKGARILSLPLRLGLGLGSVLLPFFAAASLGVFYLLPALVAPLEEILAEVTEEMEPLRHLQLALLAAGMADLRRGPGADGELAALRERVDRAFDEVRAAPFPEAGERALIEAAWRHWQEGSALHAATAEGKRAAGMQLAHYAEKAASILDGVYVPLRADMQRSRAAAQAARIRSLVVTFAAFLAALAVSLYAAVRIAGPVVADVAALREGAGRLARGELSHRIAALRTDELGRLATAFNAMAERVEHHQDALSELATRDGLTGLLNRREFLRLLRDELERCRRYRHACALLMLDADRFKAVNDTWGHPAGDAVLRTIAERVLNQVRPTDRVARYGGEEFAVLLPETGADGAMSVAERIRAAIANVPMAIAAEHAITVTASIGIAAFPAMASDEQSLFAAADAALYEAKKAGRDRVTLGAL